MIRWAEVLRAAGLVRTLILTPVSFLWSFSQSWEKERGDREEEVPGHAGLTLRCWSRREARRARGLTPGPSPWNGEGRRLVPALISIHPSEDLSFSQDWEQEACTGG